MTLEERQHRTEKPSEELKVLTGFRNVITIERRAVQILEFEDLLFHHDSAVMMPDALDGSDEQDRITGLDVVTTAYHHARDHQDQKLLIAGHTDASGPDAYNEKLSRLRAENVLHVLLGERDAWVDSAKNKGKVEDYQQILTWIAAWQGWPCDPQGIDDDHGSNTDAAVEAFQQRYSEADFGEEISVDGDVGKQTWGAFFRMYLKRLEELAETDEAGLAELRGKLSWLYDDLKVTGCGEYHPVEEPFVQGRRSQTNRRIELLFYEPGEEPPTKPGEICHAGGLDGAKDCPIYNEDYYDYTYLDARALDGHLLMIRLYDLDGNPMPETPYVVEFDSVLRQGDSSAEGWLEESLSDTVEVCTVKWGVPPSTSISEASDGGGDGGSTEQFLYELEVFVDIPMGEQEEGTRRCLHNLGYPYELDLAENIRAFQQDSDVESTGQVDDVWETLLELNEGGRLT